MDKKGKITRILIIRLSAMGDVAMTVPVLGTLIAKYPNLELTVLTKRNFMPIFQSMERVEVLEADVRKKHKGLLGLWRLYRELKPIKFDAVADLHNVLRSRVLKKYFAVDGTPFVQIDKGRKEKKALTRSKNKLFHQLKTTHQRYADVFAQLGFPIDLNQPQLLKRQQLSDKLLNLVRQDTKKWVGIAPFAAHVGKMYPLALMKQVVEQLNNTEKYKMLLFGGGPEETRQLEALSIDLHNTICVAGKLNLTEELQLISNLDVMLSMDSGNAHLAANFGIPVVTVWGVTHPYAGFYPFHQPLENALLANREHYPLIPTSIYGNKVPSGYDSVMETILPEQILEKLTNILES